MVLLLRGYARTVATVLVALSLWSLPHTSLPDICVPKGAEQHDESKHVFTAAPDGPHHEHCAICHWMRTLNPVSAASEGTGIRLAAGASIAVDGVAARCDYVLAHLPARAPPSLQS